MITRTIPSSGEELPVIGLGTWRAFDVRTDRPQPGLTQVLETLHTAGGRLIDSSPMYGRSEQAIGDLTLGKREFFYATKVWTTGVSE